LLSGHLVEQKFQTPDERGIMCFSPAGSFALSGILTSVGAVGVAQNSSRSHRMFAATPFVFAAQQASEGVVWLTVEGGANSPLYRLAVVSFLAFALVVWPLWVPMSLRQIERNALRRRALTNLSWLGVCVSVSAALLLALRQPVAAIAGHSMTYGFGYGRGGAVTRTVLLLIAYVTPTIVPFFLSTANMARTIGITLVLSLAAAVLIERGAVTSVWCFFAAILSGQILVAIRREERLTVLARATKSIAGSIP
jgi:hypothetical protein